MAGRFRLGRRGGRVAVILATTAYVTGLAIAAAPPGHTFGGSCNGHLSTPGLDARRARISTSCQESSVVARRARRRDGLEASAFRKLESYRRTRKGWESFTPPPLKG